MVSCGADHTIRVWGLGGEEHKILRIHKRKRRCKSNLQCVAISPGGSSVAAAGLDACVYIWDRASGELKRKFSREEDAVRAMTFASDSSLLSASRCRQISRWIVDSDRESSTLSIMSLDRDGSISRDESPSESSKKALPADQVRPQHIRPVMCSSLHLLTDIPSRTRWFGPLPSRMTGLGLHQRRTMDRSDSQKSAAGSRVVVS